MALKVADHYLVPKHTILPTDQKGTILAEVCTTNEDQLPIILKNDPAIKRLKPQSGDIVRIERKSPTAGSATYYRVVR